MSKTAAIQTARQHISVPRREAGAWVFSTYRPGRGTTISRGRPYAEALAARRVAIAGEAAAIFAKRQGHAPADVEEVSIFAEHLAQERPEMTFIEILDRAMRR